MRRAFLATAVMVLVAALSRGAAAQEDWSPRYVPPAGGAQPVPQPSAPAPATPARPPSAPPATSSTSASTAKDQELRQIAEQFAPIIHHGMAGGEAEHRFDYPTNIDFDNDWTGNNNWEHAADPQYKLWSFVYYSVVEGEDHYFIHYVVFHPRTWSASAQQPGVGNIVEQIQQKMRQITGQGKAAEPDHENDLEGALVIVDKWADGGPAVAAVETMSHGQMQAAVAPGAQGLSAGGELRLENGHPILYVESQKHGIHPWQGEQASDQESMVTWRFGKTMEISRLQGESGTYELVSLSKTLWTRAKGAQEGGPTFGTVQDFGDQFCSVAGARRPACEIGTLGATLRGDYGVPNAASAPWMWSESDGGPQGTWFFDPAFVLKQDFGVSGETEKYLYHPYLGIAGSRPGR